MKLNRKWALVIALVLSMTMAISGTLAYLTDRDTATNTFTMGNVGIEVEEIYEQNSELAPGVAVTKEAGIKNVHRTEPAWVWMTVSVPNDLVDHITLDWKDGISPDPLGKDAVHEGYTSYLVKHPTQLEAGASTPKYLKSIMLDADVDFQGGNYVTVVNGQVSDPIDVSIKKIIVDGFAIQTDGFATVDLAYAAYTNQWGGLNGGDSGVEAPGPGDDPEMTYPAPSGAYEVSNSEQLKTALNNKTPVILLKDGEYNWSGTGHNGTAQTVSIYGESKNAVLKVTNEGGEGGDNDFDGYTVTFTNLTITSDNDWATGWKRMNATFNDCIINNNLNLVNGNHVFNYCTLNQSANQYNIWTYGASNAEFNNCTFNCAGKSIYVDGNRGNTTTLNINNCVFNDNGGVENKAAIETGTTYGDSYVLKVNNTTVNGFAVNPEGTSTNSTLWANKHSMTTDQLNVVVDGVDVY